MPSTMKELKNPLVVECIGAFFLTLTAGLGGSAGVVLGALVYYGGFISGAHFNPAVTLAFAVRKKYDVTKALGYVVVQFLGALLAGITAYFLTYDGPSYLMIAPPGPAFTFQNGLPTSDTSVLNVCQALVAEMLFTFLLASVVTSVTEVQGNNQFYGIAVGATLVGAGSAISSISGASLNPAVSTGLTLGYTVFHGNWFYAEWLWIYFVAPGAGGLLAGLVSDFYLSKDDYSQL
eukprot:TRINITY_DN1093_c0_g1_i3.p1 TRINITY_DN1093_c0_g1~~TRINITY_DN1093_c0_g1_i3.p1  ORF type:complete len:234 (+),score=37.18 TRINITY_DN1093_c0_g1_i3:69-770(+)